MVDHAASKLRRLFDQAYFLFSMKKYESLMFSSEAICTDLVGAIGTRFSLHRLNTSACYDPRGAVSLPDRFIWAIPAQAKKTFLSGVVHLKYGPCPEQGYHVASGDPWSQPLDVAPRHSRIAYQRVAHTDARSLALDPTLHSTVYRHVVRIASRPSMLDPI
jgi:hypothetical protein